MPTRLLISFILMLALSAPAQALLGQRFSGGQVISASPDVSAISLSGPQTYPNGSPSGTVIGSITDTLTFGSFTIPPGTNVLQNGGTDSFGMPCDAANTTNFQIIGNATLELNTTLSGTFNVCVVGDAHLGGSALIQAFTITGTSASQTISSVFLSSGGSFAGGSGSGTVAGAVGVTMSPASPAFSGSLALISSGVDHSGTTCSSSNSTNFHLSSSNIVLSTTLAAGSYPGVCVQATAGSSTFTQAFTLVGTTSGAVFSMTVKNGAGSTTPTIAGTTQVPTHFGTEYPPAAVPEPGNVLVASIGGTPLTNYQIDSQQCSFWYTGSTPTSLRFCPFSGFVPQMASGATAPIQFTITSGSFPTTSSVTPATIAAASDFKVVLSNANNSFVKQQPGNPSVYYGIYPGFYVSGGAISGGFIRNIPTGTGMLGYSCNTALADCITPANYQTSTSATTASGSKILTFAANQIPAHAALGYPGQITIIDVTNPSSIPDNTTVASSTSVAPFTVSMSAAAAANITSGDVLEYGYAIQGGTSLGAFTVNTTSGIATGVNIIKAGTGFSALGSGAMTADIDTILNEYGSTDPPSCASALGAGSFTGAASGTSLTDSALTGAIGIGQVVSDGTHTALITAGSGTSWTVSNSTLVSGAMTSNTPLCVYTSGPTMYGLAGFGAYIDNISGAPDAWNRFRFTIEAWTGPTGLYAIKPTITTDNSIWKNQQGIPIYTYDADFKNGSTEVIGAAQGGAGNVWTAIIQQVNGSWTTLDPCAACATGASGRPVWLPTTTGTYSAANSQALAQVVLAPTPSDAAFIHASHAALPLDNSVVPSPAVVTTGTGNFGSLTYPNLYAPYEHGGMDNTTGFGSGGAGHAGLGPMGGLWGAWYLSAANSASDAGVSWLQNMRVAADSLPGVMIGIRYDDTQLPLNLCNPSGCPTPPAAFTDTPVWDAVYYQYSVHASYPNDFMWPGLQISSGFNMNRAIENEAYGDTSHWPELERGEYLAEAERYILQNWIDEAGATTFDADLDQARSRSLSFGGRRYDAANMTNFQHRSNAWWLNSVGPLAYLGPPNEPAIAYYQGIVSNNFDEMYNWFGFVGSGNYWSAVNGASAFPFTKHHDNTANGSMSTPQDAALTTTRISDPFFMDYYWAMTIDDEAMYDNCNSTSACGIAHVALDNFLVKNNADNCTYNSAAYVGQWAQDTPTQTPNAGWDATTLASPLRGNGPVSASVTIHTEAGSSIVSAALPTNSAVGAFIPTATAAVATGLSAIPLSSVTSPSAAGKIVFGWVIKDITNPTALTWPTYVTSVSGLTINISSPVTGPGISLNDQIVVSSSWPWTYPIYTTTRLATGARVTIANVNWNDEQSPNDLNQGVTTATWPPSSTPQVNDGDWDYLCMDASGAAFGVWSTTSCGSPTPVTWNVTANFSHATVPNASCPAASNGDWRNTGPRGTEEVEMWPTSRWRQALNGVLGTSTDAATAQTNIGPWVLPANTTYGSVAGSAPPGWAGASGF